MKTFKQGTYISIDDGALLYYIKEARNGKYRLGVCQKWRTPTKTWKQVMPSES